MVTVIIINWNSGNLLQQCLKDLDRQELAPSRILVIDNGSTDGSADAIDETYGAEVHKLGANLGFAGGNNLALELVETEFVALLNPDAFPEVDWLKRLVAAAQDYPDAAAFGSLQMMHGSSGLIDGVGDIYHLSGLVWRQGYGCQPRSICDTPFEIFSPCGGAALYRTEVLRQVSGFDEDFFCYIEDIDLGFRLRSLGYKAMLVPNAVAYHVGAAASGGRHSDFAVYHGHRNLVWAYVKNMPGWLFWACLPFHLIVNVASIILFAVKGQGLVILRAKRDALHGLFMMWRKRKQIQQRRTVAAYEIWRVLDKRLWPSKR